MRKMLKVNICPFKNPSQTAASVTHSTGKARPFPQNLQKHKLYGLRKLHAKVRKANNGGNTNTLSIKEKSMIQGKKKENTILTKNKIKKTRPYLENAQVFLFSL